MAHMHKNAPSFTEIVSVRFPDFHTRGMPHALINLRAWLEDGMLCVDVDVRDEQGRAHWAAYEQFTDESLSSRFPQSISRRPVYTTTTGPLSVRGARGHIHCSDARL